MSERSASEERQFDVSPDVRSELHAHTAADFLVSDAILSADRGFLEDPLQHTVLPDRRQNARAAVHRRELSVQRRIDEVETRERIDE